MVEAVIVISTMVVFSGLIIWMRQAYGMKLDMQQQTRSDALYFASHGCEDSGGGLGRTGGGGTAPTPNSPADTAAGRTRLPDSAAVSRSWNSASATMSGTASAQAAYDANARNGGAIRYGRMNLVSNVSAGSYVTCNEKKYNSQLTAWFQFGLDFLRSGGGVADLFR